MEIHMIFGENITVMEEKNVIKIKSFHFAIRIVNVFKYLTKEKSEYVMSKQLLRSGTSVGASVRESEYAESKKDFIHKLHIAQKEINETLYWIELMQITKYFTTEAFESIHSDATEIINILTSIIRSSKTQHC
jgi:four helix bundle protein